MIKSVTKHTVKMLVIFSKSEESGHIRATLDLQGADVLHPTLHDVLAAGGELHTPALEILLVVHGDLEKHHKVSLMQWSKYNIHNT